MTEPHMLARSTDPDTSHDAAVIAALSNNSKVIKSAIMQLLRWNGPRTAYELRELYFASSQWRVSEWPDCQPNTINRRVSDLANIGMVIATSRRRKSPDGREAIVWRAATRTERELLLRNHGLEPLVDVEMDWSKVRDVTRLRARIAELEKRQAEQDQLITKLQAELARREPQRYEVG